MGHSGSTGPEAGRARTQWRLMAPTCLTACFSAVHMHVHMDYMGVRLGFGQLFASVARPARCGRHGSH